MDEQRILIAKKFRWMSNSVIRITNNEGIEKLINVHQGLKVINQGTIAMINLDELTKKSAHFYFNTEQIDINQTEERLKRKYQKHFSAFYVDTTREIHQLYNNLFDVDYSVDNYDGKLVIDMSFTYVHWKMSEALSK